MMKNFLVPESIYKRMLNVIRWAEAQMRRGDLQRRRKGATRGGGVRTQLAIITQMPEYDNASRNKYIVQKAAPDLDELSENYKEWVGNGESIEIDRIFGHANLPEEAEDVRNWMPLLVEGQIVEIVQLYDKAEFEATTNTTKWFIRFDFWYVGPEGEASLRHDSDNKQSLVVWR